jgi:hypothetical protein
MTKAAIRPYRPEDLGSTLSADMIDAFDGDTRAFARY